MVQLMKKSSKESCTTNPLTITIKDEGNYIIKVSATDKSGNTTDKTSKQYVINKKGPKLW